MPARRAYAFLYQQCVANLTEEGKLKIDALLGDVHAQRTIDRQRLETAQDSGWEVG